MKRSGIVVHGFLACLLVAGLASSADAGKIEFLVAELPGTVDPHGDSYVLTIDESETELLEHARALVDWIAAGGDPETSPGATIVVSDMAAGPDGINRDVLAPGEPLWSWHLVGTPSFTDFTIEILDGWPTFVEQDVQGWIDNTNGQIGFWGYTVAAELGPAIPEPSAVALFTLGAVALLIRARSWRSAAA